MSDKGSSPLFISEPAGNYTRYPPQVVDCSVLAIVLFDEPDRETALLAMAGRELFAPDLLDHEMVSVALKKSGLGMHKAAEQALRDLSDLRLTRCAVDGAAQFELARRMKLTAYDAAYLQLAMDLCAPLATFDQKLGKAAKTVLAQL
jgi:predicted nucleic acid-binding protein